MLIDCIITDPPYNINFSSQRRKEKFEVIDNDNLSDDDFTNLLQNYFTLCYQVLKDDSFLISFMGWSTIPFFEKTITAAGFEIKSMLIWVKNNFGLGYYTRPQYEPMYLCLKGNPKPPQTAISDVIHCAKVKDLIHSCQKPLPLIEKLIQTFCPPRGVVFDGFMGSGTTAVAAYRQQRDFIGFELNSDCYKTAANRINNEMLQPSFFDFATNTNPNDFSQNTLFDFETKQ